MSLSNDLISQFVKATNDDNKENKESTVYGTAVVLDGKAYVTLDGSELLTPVSTVANIKDGDRVTVSIKNHTATVTGNASSPAPRSDDVTESFLQVNELLADKVSTKTLEAETARINDLYAKNVTIEGRLVANEGYISDLETGYLNVKQTLTANEAEITKLKAEKIDASVVEANYATIENLEATDAKIYNLEATFGDFKVLTADNLSAVEADIEDLYAKKLNADDADLKYANIDFTNIGKAAMEYFYANSGLIKNVIVGDQTIAGELVGVTIKGDLIEANTLVADKLVIKGTDGLYYKLNTDGVKTESEQTDYNSLNGQVIRAKSVTAEKIAVEDLVAFDATIAGLRLTDGSIYSGVKESVDNTTRGFYLDKIGQMAVGDTNNFIKYYKDQNGEFHLEVSARSITFGSDNRNIETAFDEAQAKADAAIISTIEQFYQSDYPTSLSGGEWSIVQPVWEDGKYIWRRTKVTYGNGSTAFVPSEDGVCITGNTGSKGEDSVLLRIESSRGTVFKNDQVATVLSAVIYKGAYRITDSATMKSIFGNSAYLQWKWQRLDDDTFGVISSSDSRFGDNGFTFTLSPQDVDTKVTFMCELII